MRDGIRALVAAAMSLAATCTTCFGWGTTAKPDGTVSTCSTCGGKGDI